MDGDDEGGQQNFTVLGLDVGQRDRGAPPPVAKRRRAAPAPEATTTVSPQRAVGVKRPRSSSACWRWSQQEMESTAAKKRCVEVAKGDDDSSTNKKHCSNEDQLPAAAPPTFSCKPIEVLHRRLIRGFVSCTSAASPDAADFTPIQRMAWDAVVGPSDVVIRSETGSGKTLAFAAPLMHMVLTGSDAAKIGRALGAILIVLAPTRELSLQCESVFRKLLLDAPFVVVGALHGGESKHKEKARLRKGVNILVCTPGRLIDHLSTTSSFVHANLRFLVLDEADRLLDLGFENAIRGIMSYVAPRDKRILVSATITSAVERLEHFALRDPVIRIGETDDSHFTVPKGLVQHYIVVPAKHRLTTLVAFILGELRRGCSRFVVFLSASDSVEFHYLLLSRAQTPFDKRMMFSRLPTQQSSSENAIGGGNGGDIGSARPLIPCSIFKLHGNMTQVDRSAVFKNFTEVRAAILLCTDVAARGLDIPNINWIVHFDPPSDERCYIHRVGRTARIGNEGESLLFLMPHESQFLELLSVATEGSTIHEKSLDSVLFSLVKLSRRETNWIQLSAKLHASLCDTVNEDHALQTVAMFAYESFIRAYSSYPKTVKHIFSPVNLHLGHIARSFLLDKPPKEQRRALQMDSVVKGEMKRVSRAVASRGRDNAKTEKKEAATGVGGEYHPTLSARRFTVLQDRQSSTVKRSFSEFDAR